MSNEQDQTNETEELFIEELGEVRGGVVGPRLPVGTFVQAEDPGIFDQPWLPPSNKPVEPGPGVPVLPPPVTIMFMEDGPTLPRPNPFIA